MAYIIPNAGSTGSPNKYANINQAEPDSVDIEALGNPLNYIRSGGVVSHISNTAASVSAGVAVIGGKPYTFTANSSITISAATNYRFDLIVVRLSGSTAAVTHIVGVDHVSNPTLPKSRTVLNSGESFSATDHYDPATDVLLASVFRSVGVDLDAGHIVDKRIFADSPVTYTIAGTPSVDAKDKVGDIVVDTTNNKPYARLNSTWEELVTASSLRKMILPIGAIFAWPGSSLPPTVGGLTTCLPCNGQTFDSGDYPQLAIVLGTTYGASVGTTFTLPNLNNDRTIVGATSSLGSAGGANSVSLVEANIPRHNHSVAVANHAVLTHSTTVSTEPNHTHATVAHVHNGAVIYRPPSDHNGFHVVDDADSTHGSGSTADAFHVDVLGVNEEFYPNPLNPGPPTAGEAGDLTEAGGAVFFQSAPDTVGNGAHTHTVTIGNHSISNHTVTESNFGASPVTAVPTQPSHLKMRWFIQAL
jgi:microcystin-dependent protein